MPAPERSGPGVSPDTGPGLFASVRSFWSVLLAILYTRLDLASAELEDGAVRVAKLVVAALVALASFHAAFFFLMLFVLAAAWDNYEARLWVIGGIFALYLIVGFVYAAIARNMIASRPRFFSQTIAELRRDVEGLKRTMAAKKEEPKP
jgi:uncharacterized membrane protein YqjE